MTLPVSKGYLTLQKFENAPAFPWSVYVSKQRFFTTLDDLT